MDVSKHSQGFPTFERFQGGLVLVSHDARLIQATGQRLLFSRREAQVVSWNANTFMRFLMTFLITSLNCMDMRNDHLCLYRVILHITYILGAGKSSSANKPDELDMILGYSTSETMGCLGAWGYIMIGGSCHPRLPVKCHILICFVVIAVWWGFLNTNWINYSNFETSDGLILCVDICQRLTFWLVFPCLLCVLKNGRFLTAPPGLDMMVINLFSLMNTGVQIAIAVFSHVFLSEWNRHCRTLLMKKGCCVPNLKMRLIIVQHMNTCLNRKQRITKVYHFHRRITSLITSKCRIIEYLHLYDGITDIQLRIPWQLEIERLTIHSVQV